ncbi:MAG: protein-L-isoaspartate O-methyltransferase [Caulobacterales bacterium]
MFTEDELAAVRRAYAKQVVFAAGVSDQRIEEALASIPREAFLGPGPWQVMRVPAGYRTTPTADPVYLYQDVLVGIQPEKLLNNGQPSFLASLISLGRLQPGEHAVHIGAGLGYYTAVMSALAGAAGRVTAIEFEPLLASRAAANLAGSANVRVIEGDGATVPFEAADVIYVNAGAVRPAERWLDGLKDGGRLVLPMTVSATYGGRPMTQGAVFLIERDGERYSARSRWPTAIYPCAGPRDARAEEALAAAFARGGWDKVTRLHRTGELPEEQCWVQGDGWALAFS